MSELSGGTFRENLFFNKTFNAISPGGIAKNVQSEIGSYENNTNTRRKELPNNKSKVPPLAEQFRKRVTESNGFP